MSRAQERLGSRLTMGCPAPRLLLEVERAHLLAQDFRMKERFGFDSHLPCNRVCVGGKKPSAFVVGPNIEHPTANIEPRT